MTKLNSLFLAIALTLPIATASATGAGATGASPASRAFSGSLTPEQRGAAIGQFVRQWGRYVEQVYGVDVATWSQRMVGQFAQGDATNIQRALVRTTYEGAMAELAGGGKKLSDNQVINQLAKSPGSVQPTLLGDTGNDLVFTPITPCRIVDTRSSAAGPIAANTTRGFNAWGITSYATYGGSSTDCGLLSEHPSALLLNVTAVLPTGAGYATVFDGGLATAPFVASVNYVAGDIANNSLMVDIRLGNAPDYKIYSFAQSHYVVDVVGYYDNPHATALDCVDVAGAATALPPGFTSVTGGTCAAGFEQVAMACDTSNFNTILAGQRSASRLCFFNNPTATAYTGTAITTCCRTPGR